MRLLAAVLLPLALAPAVFAQRAVPSHAPARPPAIEVARVNGVPVMSDRLDMAVNRLIPLESFHRTVSAEKLTEFRQKALDGLIAEELQYQEGVRLGVTVSGSEIKAQLERYPRAAQVADLPQEIRRALLVQKTRDRVVNSQCQATQDDARRFFAASPERFVVPEQLRIYAITIGVDPSASPRERADAGERARTVLEQLKAGADFGDLARRVSTDRSKGSGGDMGFIHRGSLNDAFEEATRNLTTGQTTGVIETIYGYHIVKIGEIKPPLPKTFAEVGAELVKDLTAQRCAQATDAWISGLRAGATIVVAGPKSGGRTQAPPGPAR